MSKFGNLRGFFSLCPKSDVGFKIRCQNLDFQTFFVFNPPNFGAKHWKDEKNQLFFLCFFNFAWHQNPFDYAIFDAEYWWIRRVSTFGAPRFTIDGWRSSKHGFPMKMLTNLINVFFFIVTFWVIVFILLLICIFVSCCSLSMLFRWLARRRRWVGSSLPLSFSCSSFHSF